MGDKYSESISLPDILNIRSISDIHQSMTLKLQDSKTLVLEVAADAEADLSFVQLVESARIEAKAAGKTLHLSSPASGSVLKVLQRGGFIDAFTAEDAQFWLHDEVHP
ncbi:MAG: hypothetical protein KGI75_26895 [Rhizobiaceae bacterium]|nr:hypothetical protein [Rhizobiaceae bacterium]